MSVSRFNSEGYHDPVAYEALTNMEKEQRAAVRAASAYRPLVYICSPYAGDVETNAENARKYSRFKKLIMFGCFLPEDEIMRYKKAPVLPLKAGPETG